METTCARSVLLVRRQNENLFAREPTRNGSIPDGPGVADVYILWQLPKQNSLLSMLCELLSINYDEKSSGEWIWVMVENLLVSKTW